LSSEFALKNADGARAADVMGEQDIDAHPDIVTGLHVPYPGRFGQDFFRNRHCHGAIPHPEKDSGF
jgi:hypothetical protein